MNINATLTGELLILVALCIGLVSYVLAKGKTDRPGLAALLGAVLGLIPPLGLIYQGFLLFKQPRHADGNS